MNRKIYKKAMSGVQPSEQMVERIMDMTNSRRKFTISKGLIATIVALTALIIGGLTANAASDGAVADAIDNGVQSIKLFVINGKDISSDDPNLEMSSITNENGDKIDVYRYKADESSWVEIELASEENESSTNSVDAEPDEADTTAPADSNN